MPDDRGMLRPDESASVKDDDFVIESHSDVNAFAPTPADTTGGEEPPLAAASSAEAVADDAGDEQAVSDPDAADGQVSESRLGKTTAVAAKPKAKNKVPLEKRTVQLKHEVDTLTHAKHRTKGELDAAERRLADLNREIAAREAGRGTGQPPAQATPEPATMPTVPNYRAFATDEEYEAAVGKYHADLTAYQSAQIAAAERRITDGVESRFRGVGQEAAAQAALERREATKERVIATKPDWEEKRAALKDVTSSWYDPTQHGEATAPFLSDLASTRLSMGLEDGGELLYWLGEDPDRAQAVADLFPTRPIRDAMINAPSVIDLLEHFTTDAGQREFETLKRMHPIRVNQAIGALSVRLSGASSGSPAVPHPITKAQPSARPPAGTPGARGIGAPPGKKPPLEDWMKAEDQKELAKKLLAAGLDPRIHGIAG